MISLNSYEALSVWKIKFSVVNFLSGVLICCRCFFFSVKIPKMNSDAGAVSGFALPAMTCDATNLFFLFRRIHHLLSRRCFSKVAKSVVGSDAVDVINCPGRPITNHHGVGNSMRCIVFPIDCARQVAPSVFMVECLSTRIFFIPRSAYNFAAILSFFEVMFRSIFPCEQTSAWIVIKAFLEKGDIYHDRSSLC